jgi:uncharacterized protein
MVCTPGSDPDVETRGGEGGRPVASGRMETPRLAPRLARLPLAGVLGIEVREAVDFRSRLLGLAFLERSEAGAGLLLPRCSSVHTVGMWFPLDIVFLDASGVAVAVEYEVGSRRFLSDGGAAAILELPGGLSAVDLVGEGRQVADAGIQRVCKSEQGGVARVTNTTLQAADVSWMDIGGIRKRLLA